MKENKKDSEPKSLEIKFGMVFANWFDGVCSLHVIVDTCKESWFETAQIIFNKDKIALGLPGTASPEYAHLVLGEWTKEQILVAFENYFETPISKTIIDEVNKNSLKPPRTIYF